MAKMVFDSIIMGECEIELNQIDHGRGSYLVAVQRVHSVIGLVQTKQNFFLVDDLVRKSISSSIINIKGKYIVS